MEWIRQNLEAAKQGDFKARLRLAVPIVLFVVVAYLQFGAAPPSRSIETKSKGEASLPEVKTNLFVHIVGEIKNPGVYALASGARLYDLVAVAGGFTKLADQSSVNLARLLNDGEQVQVYRRGVDSLSAGPSLLNLNRSSASQLEELPGVGPKLASRIIDWRSANGGFSSVDQLRQVGGIGDKLFAGIKDLVTI